MDYLNPFFLALIAIFLDVSLSHRFPAKHIVKLCIVIGGTIVRRSGFCGRCGELTKRSQLAKMR
jgi:hypothetical protein